MRASGPRVAIAATLYNNAAYLPIALESLLSQTMRDFGLVLVDDASTDETAELAERYAAQDERVVFRRNEQRLGIIHAWRRAYALARELFPSAEYFAWASDHDVWRPRWLEALVERLDRSPETVLVYPLNVRISETGEVITGPWRFSTEGRRSAAARLWRTCQRMRAGSMVYGLYRRSALERLRIFRWVREPDNLLLAELSVQGEFFQVPEILWERRFAGIASRPRARASLFLDRAPWYARVAPWLEHACVIFWRYVVSGDRPVSSRLRGLLLWLEFVAAMVVATIRRWVRKRYYGARKKARRVVVFALRVRSRMRRRARRLAYLLLVRIGLRHGVEEGLPVEGEEPTETTTSTRA